jgi:pimeloyl-ACP methyl ester carboxylesterase
MSGAHLSAEELQQYILDRPECTPESIAHVDSCPDCQTQVAAYTLLMKELGQQPPPVFGFDVSAMVMGQLAAESPVVDRRADHRTWLPTAALILLVTAVPAWLFRKSAYYVFTDISAVFLYLILVAAGLFLALRIIHLIKRYQQIINSINK